MEIDWTEFFRCELLGLLSLFPLPEGFGMATDDAAFFCHTRAFLLSTIFDQAGAAGVLIARAVAALSTAIVTIWVLWQGFMVISGTSRESFTVLLIKTGKLVFILALINITLTRTNDITATVLSFQDLITQAVVGTNGASVRTMIDINLAIAQTINQMIGSLVGGGQAGVQANQLTTTAGLLGQSGPAMVTAAMVMLAEISIAFAIMLTPLFLLFLFFQTTSALFWSWAKFLLGVFFSLAALALVSGVVLSITATYGSAVALAIFLNAGETANIDISGSSMRLAALGSLMTVLVISVPPMIMQFFNAGVGFAAGAIGGMMGGAMAGRMAGGGTGVPGMVYGGAGGGGGQASGGALPAPSGSSQGASVGQQTAMLPASARGGGSDVVAAPAGSMGLAAAHSGHAQVDRLREQQFGADRSEFRAGADSRSEVSDARVIERNNVGGASGDPTLTDQGRRAVAADDTLGRGGRLPVAGSATPTHASGPPVSSGSGGAGNPGSPPGAAGDGGGSGSAAGSSGSGRSSETPIGDTPPPHAPTHASAARPQPRTNHYGTQTRQT